MICKNILLFAFLIGSLICDAQQVIPLYSGKIPDSKDVPDKEKIVPNAIVDTIALDVSIPKIKVFLPPADIINGTAVIICPGGGYHALLIKREGEDIARALNKVGVTAFVLKYRLPSNRIMKNKSIGPIEDVQKSIQIVRRNAKKWGINPDRIGIMGFSAGGHLAAMAGTHFTHSFIKNKNNINLRPDFMILIYPVISFTDSIGHIGSRENLLGPD